MVHLTNDSLISNLKMLSCFLSRDNVAFMTLQDGEGNVLGMSMIEIVDLHMKISESKLKYHLYDSGI